MYKISIPVSMTTITAENLPIYLEMLKKCRAERVFLCGIGEIYTEETLLKTNPALIKQAISFFQENDLEVGVWVNAFGHGAPLAHEDGNEVHTDYTLIEGINGERVDKVYCPLDPQFLRDYCKAIQEIAALSPDLIMLDDDFRINVRARQYYFGCFCKHHLEKFYERIGERIPRKDLEALILCGGENNYRSAYLEVMGESLLHFARTLRVALDEVDPAIRLGTCATPESWDLCGTDLVEIAKAFAGNTPPFSRISGAPYWNNDIIPVAEYARQQYAWSKCRGVELFSEGDVYPRPRYNIPSKPLELFDLIMLADGTSGGMLHYVMDYGNKPGYENGYINRLCRNQSLRESVQELFAGKHPVGVRVCSTQHKFKTWELPQALKKGLFNDLQRAAFSPSQYLLAQNSIPTCYEKSLSPALVLGTNANEVTLDDLRHGAILDVEAALILQRKGIDTGLLQEEKANYSAEYFEASNDSIGGFSAIATRKIVCHENATVLSCFLPERAPASYLYENQDGLRFFVLAFDYYASHENTLSIVKAKNPCPNYYNNYYRQADLLRAIEWLGKKPLPAKCPKNPGLYILASKGEDGSLSVALCNSHVDDVLSPTVTLDRAYGSVRFVNCTGVLEGNTVTLSDIPPYGFAAFEVSDPINL